VAEEEGAQVVIRGLRNFKDLEDEQVLAMENRLIAPNVETVFVPCLPQLMHVSSSMVKGHVGVDPDWEAQVSRSVPVAVVTKLKEKYILAKAAKHWAALIAEIGNLKAAKDVFNGLVEAYSEPHRSYHTLTHVVSMLDEIETLGDEISFHDPAAVKFAVWYHDVVYIPVEGMGSNRPVMNNEERSADRLQNDLEVMGLPAELNKKAQVYIMCTTHQLPNADHDAQFVMDLDLLILGKPPKEFDRYEAGIRAEYGLVPEPLFRDRRAKFLRAFLDREFRPSIYQTELFRSRYEAAARENLARSLAKLE
jgi:predicted metal-dependent HD superfamily phosphohydrolase